MKVNVHVKPGEAPLYFDIERVSFINAESHGPPAKLGFDEQYQPHLWINAGAVLAVQMEDDDV